MSEATNKTALPIDDVIMSESDCARLIGVSPETAKRLRRHGEGPPYFQVTKAVFRYSRSVVLAWLQSRMVEGATIKKVGEESKS